MRDVTTASKVLNSLRFTDKRVFVDLAVVVVPLHVMLRAVDHHAVLCSLEVIGFPLVPVGVLWRLVGAGPHETAFNGKILQASPSSCFCSD